MISISEIKEAFHKIDKVSKEVKKYTETLFKLIGRFDILSLAGSIPALATDPDFN
jgi:hypothetical protein